ncbi:MAG: sigma-70 family RNA polymerase sigma factor, partial [Verrucomicrobiaceae bacterium]
AFLLDGPSATDGLWSELSPHLDAALGDLTDADRDVVLLRYFENKSAREIAAVFGISAEAAQKRLSRALEKLRKNLAGRGVVAGSTGLVTAISTNAVQAAPAGMIAACIRSALTADVAAAAGASGIAVARKALACVAVVVVATVLIYQGSRAPEAETQVATSGSLSSVTRSETVESSVDGGEASGSGLDTSRPQETGSLVAFAGGRSVGEVHLPPEIDWMFFKATRDGPQPFHLIDGKRRLSTAAADAAQLTEEERQAVQGVIDTTWDDAEEDLVARIKSDDAASSPEQGKYVFLIPPAPDRDRNLLAGFQLALAEVVGQDRSLQLCKMFNPEYGPIGAGGHDLRIEITVPPVGQDELTLVETWKINPDTGEVGGRSRSSIEPFKRRYGDIIDFDAVTPSHR